MPTTLEDRFDLLKREVDEIQIRMMSDRRPWYYTPSILISGLALLFSFGSTYVSYLHTKAEDIQAARAELRGLIKDLNAIPLRQMEFEQAHAADVEMRSYAGSQFAEEKSVLAQQAAEVIARIPEDYTATEAYAVGFALSDAGKNARAAEVLTMARDRADDPMVFTAIARQLGAIKFAAGDVAGGRREYAAAKDFPAGLGPIDPTSRLYYDGGTDYYWAQQEALRGNCREASELYRRADAELRQVPQSPVILNYLQQVGNGLARLGACASTPGNAR